MTDVGLRVDVDTWRGTRDGVPRLLDLLDAAGVRATFFFSVGPDNMGRHLWRLLRPAFAWKMLRSKAASLYGWDIVFAGTAWPGRAIGRHFGPLMRETRARGHEVGLHAWDHHGWQRNAGRWSGPRLAAEIERGVKTLQDILGAPVESSAAAGWRADEHVAAAKEGFGFRYNSDCRGRSMFRPLLADGRAGTPQIPVTLPTFDEMVGPRMTPQAFTDSILAGIRPGVLNTYTVHAEVEGIAMAGEFERLLANARTQEIAFRPLRELLPADAGELPTGRLGRGEVAGRQGWLGVQL